MTSPVFIVAWIVTVMTIFGRVALMKKWFWAPIFCITQEVAWGFYALMAQDAWPIFVLVLADTGIYIAAIPKWWRERRR